MQVRLWFLLVVIFSSVALGQDDEIKQDRKETMMNNAFDIIRLKEFRHNQENYNTLQDGKLLAIQSAFTEQIKSQNDRIEQLEKSQTQLQLLAYLLGVALPIVSTFVYFRADKKEKEVLKLAEQKTEEHKALDKRIKDLELFKEQVAQEKALMRKMGVAFASELPQSTGHPASDILLDKFISGSMVVDRSTKE